MFRVRPSHPSRRSASFEPLERRSLMSATVDLTIGDTGFSAAASQPSPVPGSLFYIEPTLLEDGHAPTAASMPYSIYNSIRTVPYSIYFSPTPSLTDQSVRIDYNPWGGPSVNKVATGGLPSNITPGTWYPIVVVDPDNTIPESDESNNIAVADPITVVDPHDDLVAPSFSPWVGGSSPNTAPAGTALYPTILTNYPGPLYPVNVRYSLSVDGVAGNADDIPLDTLAIVRYTQWDPGARLVDRMTGPMSGIVPVPLPADVPAGTYHLVATIDPDNVYAEPDETNNTSVGPVVTVLPASTLDLSAGMFFTGPTSIDQTTVAAPGSHIKLGAYAYSPYGQYLRPKVSFVLSANYTLGDGDDILLGSYETGATTPLPPGTAVDQGPPPTLDVTLPSNLAPGHYKIFTVIDPDNQIAETNESNNVSPGRDLTITDSTTPPDSHPINWSSNENPPPGGPIYTLFPSINPQSTVTFRNITAGSSAKTSVTLTNPSGKSTTAQFKVVFYFSSDDKLARNDQRFATQTITVTLRPHQTKTQQITYKIPPSTKSGQRYVITTFTPLRPSTTVVQSSPPPTLLNVQPKTTSLKTRPLSKQMLDSDQPHA